MTTARTPSFAKPIALAAPIPPAALCWGLALVSFDVATYPVTRAIEWLGRSIMMIRR